MAKKKKITLMHLIDAYMDYVLEFGKEPTSVHKFGKEHNIDESEFYQHFSSFEALEKEIFNQFAIQTLATLGSSKEYDTYDARTKLLSFYFTFFENLTANRSYVTYALNKHKNNFKNLKCLSALREIFIDYIESLDIETLDFTEERIEKAKKRFIGESAWVQLLLTMKFWMEDTSKAFEKTDIFIEKSVNTSFDILDTTPLKNIVDLGKFLFKEKMPMK
ncbi:TetR family transcriptional regulator C-terminal domain-containing protein [Mangrovimonas sp. ST2L15]|uniref:TetR/AcrR family transcriptional regulator n=1 Tax=Mangrovimonas sp. ST2L15 TaxID=1645916 RepID=UPI0006B474C3|nr:TetR family transcriptional regulator C-terminal domain-containing protein [Mangrovimonas sp. ST2L15]